METSLKRYLLFGGDTYYPAGGWDDFIGSYDDPATADSIGRKKENGRRKYDWYQIIDLTTGEEV